MTKNLQLLSELTEAMKKEITNVMNGEQPDNEALKNIVYKAQDLLQNGENLSLADKHPNIVEDIDAVVENSGLDIKNIDYDKVVKAVFNYDYSDYNDYIKNLITAYKKTEDED